MDFRLILIFVFAAVRDITCQDPLCDDELVKGLPDSQLSASSSLSDPTLITNPARAKLNTVENHLNNGTTYMGAWAPAVDGGGQYVQAMFPELTMINGIQTQGRNQGTDHVTLYKLEYTLDGTTWETVNNDVGVEQIFMGNADGDTVQDNPLDCPLFAKGIRIIPLEWDRKTSLRFEVNGCYLDNAVIVTTTSSAASLMTTIGTTNSTFLPGIVTPFGGTTTRATSSSKTTTSTTPITTLKTSPTSTTTTTTTTTTTPSTTTTTTTTAKMTTTPYIFMPGIQNPFGTTRSGNLPGIFIG